MYLWWSLCTLYWFTCMPGEDYRRQLGSLLYLRYVFRALINSLVCWFCMSALGLVSFQIIWRRAGGLVTSTWARYRQSQGSILAHDTLSELSFLVWRWANSSMAPVTNQPTALLGRAKFSMFTEAHSTTAMLPSRSWLPSFSCSHLSLVPEVCW